MNVKGLGQLGFYISQFQQIQYQVKQVASNVYLLAKKDPLKYLESQLQDKRMSYNHQNVGRMRDPDMVLTSSQPRSHHIGY